MSRDGAAATHELSSPTAAGLAGAESLMFFVRSALTSVGLPTADAERISALMVEADLTGADAHGVFRLPQYVRRIRAGGINRAPQIAVTHTGAATASVDGDNGMGHLVVSAAVNTAAELARSAGVGWVGVRRSNHAGPAGLYVDELVSQGLVGIYSAVASANHMAPWGGREALLGTNPLAIGIPAGDEPDFVLDIATTTVSYGTIKKHAMLGEPIPEGWLLSPQDGTPITDASRSAEGLLAPMGGYKGSGLALALGLLAGAMNGAALGDDVIDFNADDTSVTDTGHFVLALDPARWGATEDFTRDVDRHLSRVRSSEPIDARHPVRVPGASRATRRRRRADSGVPIPAPLRAALDQLARECDVRPLALEERP